MDGCYVWEENEGGQRFILKGFPREEPLAWRACIVDNQGMERWAEKFGKARAALVNRVPDEDRFLKGMEGPS